MFLSRIRHVSTKNANDIDKLGWEQTITYMSDPTTLEYGTFDMYSKYSSVSAHCFADSLKWGDKGVLMGSALSMLKWQMIFST
jgi:hypothetical protein